MDGWTARKFSWSQQGYYRERSYFVLSPAGVEIAKGLEPVEYDFEKLFEFDPGDLRLVKAGTE